MRGIFLGMWLLVPGLAFAGSATDVSVQQPWVRYLLPGLPAGGYLVMVNNSNMPATLTGASSPACSSLMLHESMNMGGTAMMMPAENVSVPAHGQAELVQGGYHMMCMNPKMKVGETIAITLSFGDGTTLAVSAPVYGATGGP